MNVSIVIPVIDESGILPFAVEKAWACGAWEVIVADGGSGDNTKEVAANLKCKLIESAAGRGQQMNAGAKIASGDVLLFLHADNYMATEACEQIRSQLGKSKQSYGGFRQRIMSPRWIFRLLESGNLLRAKWQGLLYGDQAIFIKRELFEQIGGFPSIQIMEDFEFSRRLRKHERPLFLLGPTFVNARRWEKNGVIRQTARNWFLATAYRWGATPQWIAKRYRRHDK